MSVLPSPVRISAIEPSLSTMPPMSCTSKWRMVIRRLPTSRVSAKDSGSASSIERPSFLDALAQLGELLLELVVLEQLELRLPRVDAFDALGVGLELLRFAQPEGALEDGHSYLA